MENLYKLIDELRGISKRCLVNQSLPEKEKEELLLFAIGKSDKTLMAISLLCKQGFGQDAAMLSRSLFELALTVNYIMSDETDGLIKRFFAYDWVQREEMYDYSKNDDDEYENIKKKAEIANKSYQYKKKGWSKINIYQMAKICGWKNMYKTIYKILCAFTHVNTRSFNDYLKVDDKGNFLVDSGPNESLIDETLILSVYSYLQILYYFDDYFNKGYKNKLNKIEDEINKICKMKIRIND